MHELIVPSNSRRPRRGPGAWNRNPMLRSELAPAAPLAPPSLTPSVVTQAQLTRLVELRRLAGELRQLRASILRMLDAGASIEPGEVVPMIRNQEMRQLTLAVLTQLLGQELVEELRSMAPLTTQRILLVHSQGTAVQEFEQRVMPPEASQAVGFSRPIKYPTSQEF